MPLIAQVNKFQNTCSLSSYCGCIARRFLAIGLFLRLFLRLPFSLVIILADFLTEAALAAWVRFLGVVVFVLGGSEFYFWLDYINYCNNQGGNTWVFTLIF